MFVLKFTQTYNNIIYDKYNITPVVEDYYKAIGDIFCVADGITQDLNDNSAVPYPKTLDEINYIMEKYPNPSGAYQAAKMCCDKFVEYMSEIDTTTFDKNILLNIVKNVNSDINKLNKNRSINYLSEDLYACQAVGGIIVLNNLYCFSIGDCHITLLDKNLNKLFETPSNTDFTNYMAPLFSKYNFNWNNPECRYMIRKFFRNNPHLKESGKDITYGALSGETEAEYYINTFCFDLTNAKYICAYSDGCEPNFENIDKIRELISNPESIKNSGKEKTLVLYEKL